MLDRINHNFIIEDLDETHLVVQENMLTLLKQHLESVSSPPPVAVCSRILMMASLQELKGTQLPDELLDDSD